MLSYAEGPQTATEYAHFWVRRDRQHEAWITLLPLASATRHDRFNETPARASLLEHGVDGSAMSLITQTFHTRMPAQSGGRPDIKRQIREWVASAASHPQYCSSTLPSGQISKAQVEPVAERTSVPSSAARTQDSKVFCPPCDTRSVCVIVSGPDPLVRDVRNVIAQLVKEGWNLEAWVEKFGW